MVAYLIALLSFLFLSATAFGQGTSANLSGTVQDASGGVLVGVSLSARNIDTGMEARVTSNDRGIYNFPSLPPGNYEVVAESAGFSRAVRTVRLSAGAQNTLNFPMTVAGTVTEVEVTGVAESVMLEASASTGNVFQEDIIQAVPMLSNNVMDTLNLMGGVTRLTTGSQVWNADEQNVAGVSAAMINVTRDGISVTEVRNPTGISAASNINTEVVGEMRIVMSPVDAELGRGAGQIQITTRSGSNTFHGSAVWSVQNTVLDAEEFESKRSAIPANWRNMNNYMLTFGGPIIKNKTFFFVNWEQQFARERVNETARVLTPCARKGIYRYLSSPEGGWIPASINTNNSYSADNGNMRSVEGAYDGTPWKGGAQVLNSNNNNQPYTVGATTLHFESVFGQLTQEARNALLTAGDKGAYGDCSVLDSNGWNPQSGGFGVVPDTYWAPNVYRNPYDTTGFVTRFTNGVDYSAGRTVMPPANYYLTGDGLNTAGHLWTRSVIGNGSSIWGTGGDPDRKSITAKFDHNINNEHRLSGTFNYEHFNIDDAYQQWPEQYGGYGGTIDRIPYGFTINLTSTIRPTLLNEVRFGLSKSDTWTYAPLEANGDKMRNVLKALLPTDTLYPSSSWVYDRAVILGAGEGDVLFNTESGGPNNGRHPYGSRGNIPATWGGADPRWSIADTVTWMKGTHAFKGGFEYRRQSSLQDYNGARAFGGGSLIDTPVVRGGLTPAGQTLRRGSFSNAVSAVEGYTPWQGIFAGSLDTPGEYGTTSGNYTLPYQMMSYFAGSVGEMSQYFYMVPDPNSPTGARWNNVEAGETGYVYDIANQEFSFFFKDDWKVTNDLTLNLGVRYEYYGVPHVKDGKTLGVLGGSKTAWGLTNGSLDKNWMKNRQYIPVDRSAPTYGNPCEIFGSDCGGWTAGDIIYPAPAAVYDFIGSGTKHPDRMAWDKDTNNFAPHVGFAWQLPWFGKGMTTLRGGYSVSYSQVNNFNMYGVWLADIATAATAYEELYHGENLIGSGPYNTYIDISDLGSSSILPVTPSSTWLPMAKRNFGDTYSTATIIDENLRSPYVHSINMSLTRNIGRVWTVDVRYIGTLGRNQISTLNLNQSNYLDTGLYNEFEKVRQGGESTLLNSILPANSLWFGNTAADQLKGATVPVSMGGLGNAPATAEGLALGNFSGLAATLATTNGALPLMGTPYNSRTSGLVAKAGCLPEDRDANGACTKGLPLNYFLTNSQFGGAPGAGFLDLWMYGGGSSLVYNDPKVKANYHSMQAQVTLRPTRGLNFQATYTLSRNLGNMGWTDYTSDHDYILSGQHRSHALNTYGTWELPFGARGFLFRDASGAFRKAIEGWQLSWITSMTSGPPMSVTGTNTLWGRSWPILVRPDLWDNKAGKAEWDEARGIGSYFGDKYTKVVDANICRPPGTTGGLDGNLYDTYCIDRESGIIRSEAPRALALSARDSSGNIVPATYTADYTGADGVTYKAGDPIIVFRNADQRDGYNASGNFNPNQLTAQGRFSFDMAMSKSIEFMEGKRFEIRVDAQNILNHPTPNGTSTPTVESGGRFVSIDAPSGLAINGTDTFGVLPSKAGHRTFQARLRLSF